MSSFDYETYYANREEEETKLVEKAAQKKASDLGRWVKGDMEKCVIAEVGTGPGDVLNSFEGFKVKIGMDISSEALQIHINKYFKDPFELKSSRFDFDEPYKKILKRKEILNGLQSRNLPKNGNLILLKIIPESALPFETKSLDYLILADVIEHVDDPVEFLKDKARVAKKLLIKIPVERALFIRLSYMLNGIKQGVNHPSGHLHCWNTKEVLQILDLAGIKVLEADYLPSDLKFSKKKSFMKNFLFKMVSFLDKKISWNFFFSKHLLGGNILILAEEKV